MRSSLVEVDGICREEAGELLLMEDQEVIQAFSPHTSQKAFTDSIGTRRPVRYAKHLDTTRCCHASKIRAEFAIVVTDQIVWGLPIRRRFAQLLRDPRIGRRAGHVHMDHLARLEFDDEKSK